MRELLVVLCAFSAAALWMSVLAPLTAKALGVPARISLWRIDRQNQHLTRTQYVWSIGVLDFGICMFLIHAMMSYGEVPYTLRSISGWLLVSLFVGFAFGFWSAPRR
jgi:hypothetical protein